MKAKCTSTNSNKLVVFEENKSKLTIENKHRVEASKIKVDGCQITDGLRCDFLYIINGLEVFIELKGQDLDHALKQIKTTIEQLSNEPKTHPKISFIICTRVPLSSTKIQNLRLKFKRDYSSDLVVQSSPYKCSL